MRAFSTFGLGGFQRGSYDDTTLDRPRRLRPSAWGLDERLSEVCNDTGRHSLDAQAQNEACRNDAKARLTPTVERLASLAEQPGGPGAKALAAPVNAIAP